MNVWVTALHALLQTLLYVLRSTSASWKLSVINQSMELCLHVYTQDCRGPGEGGFAEEQADVT